MEKVKRSRFTRKNFISMGLVYFYSLLTILCGLCCDNTNPIMKANNPIQKIGSAFGFPKINGSVPAYILLICFSLYIMIFVGAFIYEMRMAKYYDNKIWTKKWTITYIVTFLICVALTLSIGLVAQYPYNMETISNSFLFLAESLVVSLVIFVLVGTFIGTICMLYINFKNIDKPFRLFQNEGTFLEGRDKDEEREIELQGSLAESFGEVSPINETKSSGGALIQEGSASSLQDDSDSSPLKDKERVFPGLCTIDLMEESYKEKDYLEEVDLKKLTNNFRLYLASKEKLYFDIETIRAFISGLSASRLLILEGLSGTGKSSLARSFSTFIGEESYFEAVQATWRDKTSILGYYNDFSRTYNETDFLKRLYTFTYRKNDINVMVLDELNISRIEYYFADFLSILEYPIDKWNLRIMQLPYDFDAPSHLEDGVLKIPENTWFIGTANKDDSTYTITDKVYDRAIAITFNDRNEKFDVEEDVDIMPISYTGLLNSFKKAQENPKYMLNEDDLNKFYNLTSFTYETFDLTFGNRINHQIELLVPVYVACGGSKEEALDFMFARKIVSKLDGRFEDYIKQGLMDLTKLINKTYGENAFKLSKEQINKLLRKL